VTCLHTCFTTKNIITIITVWYVTSFVYFRCLSLKLRTELNQSVWLLMYWLDIRMTEVRFLAEVNDFSPLRTFDTSPWPTQLLVLRLPDAFSERIESPGHKSDCKNLLIAVVNIAWSYSFTSLHTLMTCAYFSRGTFFNFRIYVGMVPVLSRFPIHHWKILPTTQNNGLQISFKVMDIKM
jgi:hypothetical protein